MIETGTLKPISKLLDESVKAGLSERFAHLRSIKAPGDDPAGGRERVEAYVAYAQHVIGIHRRPR